MHGMGEYGWEMGNTVGLGGLYGCRELGYGWWIRHIFKMGDMWKRVELKCRNGVTILFNNHVSRSVEWCALSKISIFTLIRLWEMPFVLASFSGKVLISFIFLKIDSQICHVLYCKYIFLFSIFKMKNFLLWARVIGII